MSEETRQEGAVEQTDGAPDRAPEPARGESDLLSTAWEWTRSIAIAFALFLLIRTFGVEAFKIPTSSMENTLLVGDFLLVNKAVYGAEVPGLGIHLPALREPRLGDVIVFNPPHEPDKNYVKRLVGLPGDTLEMRDKELRRNGVPLEEPYARYIDGGGDAVHPGMEWQSHHLIASITRSYHPSRDNWGPLVVPDDEYFVLGDNRDNSEDSRYWGFVDREAIRGRPWFVYYSYDARSTDPSSWATAVRWDRVGHLIE